MEQAVEVFCGRVGLADELLVDFRLDFQHPRRLERLSPQERASALRQTARVLEQMAEAYSEAGHV
jgi:hypothetical protein